PRRGSHPGRSDDGRPLGRDPVGGPRRTAPARVSAARSPSPVGRRIAGRERVTTPFVDHVEGFRPGPGTTPADRVTRRRGRRGRVRAVPSGIGGFVHSAPP